ncbi:MAG: hypothetical protein RL557_316 [archaeon]|jgi:Kae1-associated kinase Bud32
MTNIIFQGAEAVLIKYKDTILKQRIKKSYRHQLIDEKLRKTRTRSEAKILEKLSPIINVPKIIKTDEQKKELTLEHIKGKKLADFLEKLDYKKVSTLIGKAIAKVHDQDIIHGDLTTSNMIYQEDKLYLIDFGLAFHSQKIEDKAVDLHVLKQALEAKHVTIATECMKVIIKNYKPKKYKEIIKQLKKVESRGRYKDKY